MTSVRIFATGLAILLVADVIAADNSNYQKGTLTITEASGHRSYNLRVGLKIYQIANCGDFQNGQDVQFLVKGDKIYIAHEGAKDYKCSIESTTQATDPASLAAFNELTNPIFMKGTILGYSIRRDIRVSGGGGNGGVGSSARKAKVFELQAPDLVYQVDYCGAFQAGQFTPGQVVEFRVSSEEGRLYIRHDGNKEYSCQLEGTRKPDPQPGAASAATNAPASPATAKVSVASVPEGADIEIDGNFAGNTPSDLEVPEGERSIVVKKSGYKNWERKMKVIAGSNVHLNAEMEKSTNP